MLKDDLYLYKPWARWPVMCPGPVPQTSRILPSVCLSVCLSVATLTVNKVGLLDDSRHCSCEVCLRVRWLDERAVPGPDAVWDVWNRLQRHITRLYCGDWLTDWLIDWLTAYGISFWLESGRVKYLALRTGLDVWLIAFKSFNLNAEPLKAEVSPLRAKWDLFYLKLQSVPRSKHTPSGL